MPIPHQINDCEESPKPIEGGLAFTGVPLRCLRNKLEYLETRPFVEQEQLNAFAESAETIAKAREAQAKEDGKDGTTPKWLAAIWTLGGGIVGVALGYLMGAL